MRRDHRPYYIKRLHLKLQDWYVRRILRPQFEHLGEGFTFMQPWHVVLFGAPIEVGDFLNVIATPDKKVRFSVWPKSEGRGRIRIGNCCLICPGVRISSAASIQIDDNCMIASSVYITDADWHDIYNRISAGRAEPVHIRENVWIGDSALICKGVTIGRNSVIGAGSVVVNDIPANTIVAGNPARVVKHLDPNEKIVTRTEWFRNPAELADSIDQLDRFMLQGNTFWHWLRASLFPLKGD